MPDQPVQFCRSRNGGRRCTRPLGHPGLHRHRTIMWSDLAADHPRCAASGDPAVPAATDADGYPHGRALCPVCQRFIPLTDGRLDAHDTSDAAESPAERARRREWLNTHGW
ncbi:hypothetical protein [Microbacterium dauci]|uniref:Uncharacterized protein n=1 Tax=Microbacterium dauci TaxID=3048008 RepID=A0ABT6ZD11_9MICO|nr:hypothetical protein [Microbacterium sp. LX3-4]MDJ1113866.1 hypothetical protein [Microbacterium sp. LX3-4]